MLVLTRKKDEAIVIGEGPNAVEIYVSRIEKGRIRLAIDAPKSVPINRKEVLEQKEKEKQEKEKQEKEKQEKEKQEKEKQEKKEK
jgi:carbon storage regulator CsrA